MEVVIGGIISTRRNKITKNNDTMAFLEVEDFYGKIDVIVFEKINKRIIVDCKVEENNLSKLMDIPGMTAYIVGKGDTLWSIAKEFSTTRDVIRQMNGIEAEDVKAGDKLLLVKQVG